MNKSLNLQASYTEATSRLAEGGRMLMVDIDFLSLIKVMAIPGFKVSVFLKQ